MPHSRTLHRIAFALLIALSAAAAACGEDGTDPDPVGNNDTPSAPEGVRIFHALEAVPGDIDVIFRDTDGNNIRRDGIGFQQASEYIKVPAGIHTLIVFDATANEAIADLTVDALSVSAGATSTIIFSEKENGDPQTHIIPDELAAPGENQTRLRFLNQSRGVGIDVYNQDDGIRHATGLTYGQLTPYFDLLGAEYSFDVFEEGTVANPVLTIDGAALLPASVFTFVIVGQSDPNEDGDFSDNTLEAVLITDTTF